MDKCFGLRHIFTEGINKELHSCVRISKMLLTEIVIVIAFSIRFERLFLANNCDSNIDTKSTSVEKLLGLSHVFTGRFK